LKISFGIDGKSCSLWTAYFQPTLIYKARHSTSHGDREGVGVRLGGQFIEDGVSKLRDASPLKRIPFGSYRRPLLWDTIQKGPGYARNKCVLVIDDFTQTLSTLGRVTDVPLEGGEASEV
jgi:hypothetical protein